LQKHLLSQNFIFCALFLNFTFYLNLAHFFEICERIVVFSWILFGLLWVSGLIALATEKMRVQADANRKRDILIKKDVAKI